MAPKKQKKVPDSRIKEITDLVEELVSDRRYSTEEALDNMREIEAHVSGCIDGLEEDLKAQGKEEAI